MTTPPESLRTVAADDFSAANPVSPAGASQAPVAAPLQDAYADDHAFYPLVADPESGPLESGQIVRVQLRSDVLDAAGLAPRGVGSELVEAEVLVGPDGVARGIRLARPRR